MSSVRQENPLPESRPGQALALSRQGKGEKTTRRRFRTETLPKKRFRCPSVRLVIPAPEAQMMGKGMTKGAGREAGR